MEFEWDAGKAASNLAKHRVSFEEACQIWFDPNLVVFPDRYAEGEERYIAIGVLGQVTVLQVVHVYRGEDEQRIRIVSARKATRYEKIQYSAANP